jgi:hypothetical protein
MRDNTPLSLKGERTPEELRMIDAAPAMLHQLEMILELYSEMLTDIRRQDIQDILDFVSQTSGKNAE